MLEFQEKATAADPVMVDHIIQVVGKAINSAVVPNVTTQSDLISAVFTILHRMLVYARELEDPEQKDYNAREIGNILTTFLLEFGTPSSTPN